MKFLLLLLFSSSVLALKPHTATYTLSVSNWEIATEQRILSKDNGRYTYTEEANTIGLASLLKDYQVRAKSTFIVNEFGLKSTHFQHLEHSDDTTKKDIDIHPKNQQIDPLNLFLAFTYALEKNPSQEKFYFIVNDGKNIEKQHYQQTASPDHNLIKIISKEKNITAFFAKDKYYLPVLLYRDKFTYKLDTIEFN